MTLEYDGECRRIDLYFRAKYPYLNTRIFKITDYEYSILIQEAIADFDEISKDFDHNIRFVTVPVGLINSKPDVYKEEIEGIHDKDIPSKFEGLPLNLYQLSNHISCTHPYLKVCRISENHIKQTIAVELVGKSTEEAKSALQITLDNLKMPYKFEIVDGGEKEIVARPENEIFNIASSLSKKHMNLPFLERDEKLWFENVDAIYGGVFSKKDLYFFDRNKTSCLVNFSKFKNVNLRNHILLYDVIYCILPLADNMKSFLSEQKIKKEEILFLVEKGRIKILNMQPESRLDYGFLREAYQTNPSSVVSRRAISALCAIDLVEMNQAYIFNDPEFSRLIYPLLLEFAKRINKPLKIAANLLLWPKHALRSSFDTLNNSGPMAIPRYGINNPIIENITFPDAEKKPGIEFEFVVNSDQIHLAHALDATYFPFFVDNTKYTDHPFALMMGNMLNFYKTANYQNLQETMALSTSKEKGNPSIQLVNTFDINEYLSIEEFEKEISSSVIRKGINSLFSELSELDDQNRTIRISEYNKEVDKLLSKKNVAKHILDLGEDAVGLIMPIPFLSTGGKLLKAGAEKVLDKSPTLQRVSEYIEDKTNSGDNFKRKISLLTKINRVARLKRKYD